MSERRVRSRSRTKKRENLRKELLRVLDEASLDARFLEAVAGIRKLRPNERRRLDKLRRHRGPKMYSDLLFALTQRYFAEERAQDVWTGVVDHHGQLASLVGRSLGLTAAAADYLTNVTGLMPSATLIPAGKISSLADLALRDSLTGLVHRSVFFSRLEQESKRYHRYAEGFGVLMLDLDDFKQVNDTLGHERGDDVLRAVGRLISRATRKTDTACRYGGEEFALLVARATVADAVQFAERLRRAVERKLRATSKTTISAGVAGCPQHATDPADLVKMADRALYRAKRSGKNRVETL